MMFNKQRENEEALKKVEMEMMLERQLAAKQNMEMQIEELKVTLQVMKRLGDDDVQELINKMNDDLEAKMKEISDIEEMNQDLIVMERQRNDELQARKELIKVLLSDVLQISINVQCYKPCQLELSEPIYEIGSRLKSYKICPGDVLDLKAFQDACYEKFDAEEAQIKASELCALWQDKLKDLDWHPLKVVAVDGAYK
ncbi:factor of DNA methylation 1-like protein, partial [Tanacetum coccineum]